LSRTHVQSSRKWQVLKQQILEATDLLCVRGVGVSPRCRASRGTKSSKGMEAINRRPEKLCQTSTKSRRTRSRRCCVIPKIQIIGGTKSSSGIDLDQVVTEDALRRHLKYSILVGKIPLDKNRNPLNKANTFEGPTVGGTDRPTKKIAQTKKKSSKSFAPKGINPGV
jgi:hypothetical protein